MISKYRLVGMTIPQPFDFSRRRDWIEVENDLLRAPDIRDDVIVGRIGNCTGDLSVIQNKPPSGLTVVPVVRLHSAHCRKAFHHRSVVDRLATGRVDPEVAHHRERAQ
jgi:hypothetical protein